MSTMNEEDNYYSETESMGGDDEEYAGRQEYEDDDFNYRDLPTAGVVNETNETWNMKLRMCVHSLQKPYSDYYESSVKPEAFVSNVHYKQYRNAGSMLLGYCLYLAHLRRPERRVSTILTDIMQEHTDMVDSSRITHSSVLREFEYFKLSGRLRDRPF